MAILGIVFAFVCWPLGLILSLAARRQISRTGELGDGLALAGLSLSIVLGSINIVLFVIILSRWWWCNWIVHYSRLREARSDSLPEVQFHGAHRRACAMQEWRLPLSPERVVSNVETHDRRRWAVDVTSPTNVLAILGLVFAFFIWPLGLILGAMARRQG
jgi:hypothetical protein